MKVSIFKLLMIILLKVMVGVDCGKHRVGMAKDVLWYVYGHSLQRVSIEVRYMNCILLRKANTAR